MRNDDLESHDLGLRHDAARLVECSRDRRRLLAWLAAGGAGLLAFGALSPRNAYSAATACAQPGEDTAGPFPAHGSNRGRDVANVLADSGVVRSDIRSSFGTAAGVAAGLPLDLRIRLLDANNACAPLAGYVMYLWNCTADGRYSLYSDGVTGENFLRGVQAANADGELTFRTVFPGCYSGRYPHLHFEVFPDLDLATVYTNRVFTSQIVLPVSACAAVYATDTYAGSAPYFARTSIVKDSVFNDNTREQMAAATPELSGNANSGFEGALTIGV